MSVMLLVDGLPLPFSSEDLRKLTEPHSPIVKCWIATEPGGNSLRFGYVEVPTSNDAEAMVKELSGAQLNGKPVSVAIIKTA
jgi:RNA recognition motif-containing protein